MPTLSVDLAQDNETELDVTPDAVIAPGSVGAVLSAARVAPGASARATKPTSVTPTPCRARRIMSSIGEPPITFRWRAPSIVLAASRCASHERALPNDV